MNLRVVLDHEDGVFRAQSWLKGHIHAQAKTGSFRGLDHSHHEGIRGGALTIDVIGKEISAVPPVSCLPHGCGPRQAHEKEIFSHHQLVTKNLSELEPGTTESFPFAVYLPHHLPASMNLEDADQMDPNEGSCRIDYELVVRWKGIVVHRPLTLVGAPVSHKQYPLQVQPVSFPVVRGLGRDGGVVVFDAKVENTHVAKGEKLSFSFSCANCSFQDVERVDLRLTEHVKWKAGSRHSEMIRSLAVYSELDLPGRSTHSGHAQHSADIDTESEDSNATQRTKVCHRTVDIRIPERSLDSYVGKLVNISHFVEIVGIMKDHHRLLDPALKVPIQIFDRPIQSNSLHHSHAHHFTSKADLKEVSTATWPDDVTQSSKRHTAPTDDSGSSCQSIEEQ